MFVCFFCSVARAPCGQLRIMSGIEVVVDIFNKNLLFIALRSVLRFVKVFFNYVCLLVCFWRHVIQFAVGDRRIVLVYEFMCRNTCLGNMNSRQINAVFTLESAHGIILGRITIELRICACPGRDRRVDETALGDRSNTLDKSIKRSRSGADSVDTSAAVSKARKHDDDDRVYTLQVRFDRIDFACMAPFSPAYVV